MGALSAITRRLARGVAYYPVGGTCCLPELAGGEPEAFVRAGWVRAASPRQADLLLVAGPVNRKLAPVIERLYAQLPAPRRALLVGDCPRARYDDAPGLEDLLGGARRIPGCPVDPAAVIRAALEGTPA